MVGRMGWAAAAVAALAGGGAAAVELRGHGGPVQAIDAEGGAVLTGSFDTRAILWDGANGAAEQVLRLHGGAVTAVAILGAGQVATGGQDGRVALWRRGEAEPVAVLEAHGGPVRGLAVSPDGAVLASGGWDGTARLTPLAGGAPVVLEGHSGNVNGVAWLADGRVATAGYDATLRFWEADGTAGAVVTTAAVLNAVAVDAGGRVWTAGADGVLRAFDGTGRAVAELAVAAAPVVGLDAAGGLVAAGAADGTLAVVETEALQVRFAGGVSAGPLWAVALDGDGVLAGGADNVVRRWDAATGEPLSDSREVAGTEAFGDDPGARVFRTCAACHTLGPDDGNRAGPTLHGIFGRRIGTAAGYDYSEALTGMDIVWTPETVARLFEVGPLAMTPGTKMPEQRIPDPGDRAALVEFLGRHTR